MEKPQLSEADAPEAEELSDEQINKLLQQAEERLRNNANAPRTNLARYIPKAKKLDLSPSMKPYIETKGHIASADPSRLVDEQSKQSASKVRKVEDPISIKKARLEAKKATAGPNWFNLPATKLTPTLKRDLQLLRMRSVLDPKQFYKKENTKTGPPAFSQLATVIEGPTEFFSARIPKRGRAQTLVEEVLAGERASGRFRKKYLEVQAGKMSGKKADYRRRMGRKYGVKGLRA